MEMVEMVEMVEMEEDLDNPASSPKIHLPLLQAARRGRPHQVPDCDAKREPTRGELRVGIPMRNLTLMSRRRRQDEVIVPGTVHLGVQLAFIWDSWLGYREGSNVNLCVMVLYFFLISVFPSSFEHQLLIPHFSSCVRLR